jgi:Ni,Fe-hydrogenase III large subunit/Ni,Fe-hydrogenase III component G
VNVSPLGIAAAPLASPIPAQRCPVSSGQLLTACRLAWEGGGQLVTLWGSDERDRERGFCLRVLLGDADGLTLLEHTLPDGEARYPDLSPIFPAANRMQRANFDILGVQCDADDQRPWLWQAAWPIDQFPLRHDFEVSPKWEPGEEDYPFVRVSGDGVHEIAVGPVHAGIIEPGHFRFQVVGEKVLRLEERLGYVHKGIEKRFERLPWRHGLFLAESISGDTCVGHALAFAHAIERLVGVEPPPRARHLRVILLELERVYNHVADIAGIATDVAFTVPAARAQILREGLVAMQERLFGSRLLRGTIALGGVKCDLTLGRRREILLDLEGLQREFDDLVTLLIDSGNFTDRVDGTGILPTQVARDFGVVGLAGRASGLDLDLRRDQPHDAYSGLRFVVPVEEGGDVRARFMMRAREVEQSLVILRHVLEDLPEGGVRSALPDALPPSSSALGWAEGWRGECLHWVQTDGEGRLRRVKVTDPSFKNWQGLAHAVPGNILPDFPVINKSFNLSYSGNDL